MPERRDPRQFRRGNRGSEHRRANFPNDERQYGPILLGYDETPRGISASLGYAGREEPK
jgi:hypothetical protein